MISERLRRIASILEGENMVEDKKGSVPRNVPVVEELDVNTLLDTAAKMNVGDYMSDEHLLWTAFDDELTPRLKKARRWIKANMPKLVRELNKRRG